MTRPRRRDERGRTLEEEEALIGRSDKGGGSVKFCWWFWEGYRTNLKFKDKNLGRELFGLYPLNRLEISIMGFDLAGQKGKRGLKRKSVKERGERKSGH